MDLDCLGKKLLHRLAVLLQMLQSLLPDKRVENSPWEGWEELATMLVALRVHCERGAADPLSCPHNPLESSAVRGLAVPVPDGDTASQDAL